MDIQTWAAEAAQRATKETGIDVEWDYEPELDRVRFDYRGDTYIMDRRWLDEKPEGVPQAKLILAVREVTTRVG